MRKFLALFFIKMNEKNVTFLHPFNYFLVEYDRYALSLATVNQKIHLKDTPQRYILKIIIT